MTAQPSPPVFIGAMSGTSLDGLDLVAVTFDPQHRPNLLASECYRYPAALRESLHRLTHDDQLTLPRLGQTDTRLGQFYADSIERFCQDNRIDKTRICAVGSHGQTIWHAPGGPSPFSMQIGDANIIAATTGLDVVADFRRRDIALGGQGAPFACAYHERVFRANGRDRVIVNIGGIANITCLFGNPQREVLGFDSGPGNTLLDEFCRRQFGKPFDSGGQLARQGRILERELDALMQSESYFSAPYPKSTGTEYFSPGWLERSGLLAPHHHPADVMATLAELTARSIQLAITQANIQPAEIYVCGGGAHNDYLLERLRNHVQPASVATTRDLGVDPDWVEAITFAWLARQTLDRQPANLPSVTKAKNVTILGAVYFHRQADCM